MENNNPKEASPHKRIYLCLAHMSESGIEQKYIREAFDTNWVVPLGPNVNAFEKDIETYIQQQKRVVALNSGTAAIHLSLINSNVRPGDEVIVQAFTFCASCNPITYIGAKPVFVDSETDTWNMDPALLRIAIEDRIAKTGRKPKAIIPVALYGMPYRIDKILEVAEYYGIPVIEDAAEGFGSQYKGQALGTFGTFGILSFNGNKMITTSGGGALICPDNENWQKTMWLATQARESYPYYQHEAIGYNYRMSNVCAGIGRGQMTILNDHLNHHKHVQKLYEQLLSGIKGISVHSQPTSGEFDSNYWVTTILLDEKLQIKYQDQAYKEAIKTAIGGAASVIHETDEIHTDCEPNTNVEALRIWLDKAGIESRPLWKPMHKQPVFKDCPAYTNGVSESLFRHGMCLPAGPCVSDNDVYYICEQIKNAIEHIDMNSNELPTPEIKKRNIPFSPPDITEREIEIVTDALRSGWITTGPKTKELERQVAAFCHTERAVCLNSATACMESALRVMGIGPGDEVITTAYTYTASASVICHVGAKVVLVDCSADNQHIDYDQIASAITERTKAIIPVDLAGITCDYDRILNILEQKRELFRPANDLQRAIGRVIVLADAAHAFGAKREGKMCGEMADFTSFSFHAVKNFTTAEGGALTWRNIPGIDNEAIYKQLMLLSLHGQSKDALAKTKLGAWEYDIVAPLYKCNMTDIAAAIGLAQMERYPALLERRHQIIKRYNEALSDCNVALLCHEDDNQKSSGHLYLVRLLDKDEQFRNDVITRMAERGIACNVHYKPLPLLTAYKDLGFDITDYPHAYDMYHNVITLPLHTRLSDDDVEYIINNFKELIS